jgi:hypothetical protein
MPDEDEWATIHRLATSRRKMRSFKMTYPQKTMLHWASGWEMMAWANETG